MNFEIHYPSLAVLASLLCFFVMIGNLLVIVAVYREACLQRSVTNYYIVSLAVADLLVGILVMPFSALYDLSGQTWIFGALFCDIWYSINVLITTASILNLCAVSMDRYWAIFDPLNYASRITKRRSVGLIIVSWTISLLLAVPVMLVVRYRRDTDNVHEKDAFKCHMFTTDSRYVLAASILCFYLPLLVMSFVYFSIYRTATKQSASIKRGTKRFKAHGVRTLSLRIHCAKNSKKMHVEPLEVVGSTSVVLEDEDSLKRKLNRFLANSNRQIAKFSREHKAAKTVGIVFGVFLICWLPFFVILQLLLCQKFDLKVPYAPLKIANWLGWSNSALNPVIYIIWSRDFRRAFTRMFKCCRPRRQVLPFGSQAMASPGRNTLQAVRSNEGFS